MATGLALTRRRLRPAIAVAHDLIRDVGAVLFQVNGDTLIKQIGLLGDDVQLVGRPEGRNHSDPKERGCRRREHWIEIGIDQFLGMSHQVRRDSTAM